MNIDLDPARLIGSFLFGLLGFAAWRFGRRTTSAKHLVLAVALMTFPYFIENIWALYGTGTLLTALLFWP